MKKIFTLIAVAAMASATMMAQTINNPVGEDGRYIVKYNCEAGAFAAANDMEVDETFVLAVDLTDTWLAEWLKGTPTNPGASRGVAFNNWTNYGDTNGDFRRLKQISGNIWGVTCNYAQLMVNPTEAPKAVMADSVVYVWGQLFGFEYTAENPGIGWWMWDGNPEGVSTQAAGSDCMFTFAPYTGAKTSPDLYADDYADGDIYGFEIKGYAAPCIESTTGIENTELKAKAVKFVENGQLYILSNGVKYNALGAAVK